MKSAASVLGLVIVLAIGYWVYKAELVPGPQGGTPVLEQGYIAGWPAISSPSARRKGCIWRATAPASLDQLHEDGSIPFAATRHGYNYSVEIEGAEHFKAVAVPSKAGWPLFPRMRLCRQ